MESTAAPKSEIDVRREKIDEIRTAGMLPYAERFERTHKLSEISDLADETANVKIAGRVILIRNFGKLAFLHLASHTGKAQIAFQKNVIGDDEYEKFRKFVDIGDFIGVEGKIFTTKTGEKTVNSSSWQFLSKALRPQPEKFHGLADTEQRLRKRYLDLISSSESMDRFKKRSLLVKTIRNYLDAEDFIEIDTPVLINKASGALATPFATHHNALDIDVFLRIAPETYLKRAIAGGFERVYEFARCFRNEGMDPSHLQDFTMLEYYCAYWNYEDNMNFTERLLKHAITTVTGSDRITYAGKEISFAGEWPRVSFRDLILKDSGIDIDALPTRDDLVAEITKMNITLDAPIDLKKCGRGTIIDLLYKKVSRPQIINPTFLIKHPVDISPLARRNDTDANTVDRFQLVVNGWEVVNAYSELVDPIDQAGRFADQLAARQGGDTEAMEVDDDFLTCMEYGMPPMSGWGMGIDRLIALLTDAPSLREVVLFPLMRPE
ncbi:MAG TPA: lysine--tRNA ligase [Spirochaetota bacterium]